MQHKNDYSVIAFFPDRTVKKWNYVHRLDGFIKFLDKDFEHWLYVNVYDRRTREFLQQIKKGSVPPPFLKAT